MKTFFQPEPGHCIQFIYTEAALAAQCARRIRFSSTEMEYMRYGQRYNTRNGQSHS
jgi:hypothetical protein